MKGRSVVANEGDEQAERWFVDSDREELHEFEQEEEQDSVEVEEEEEEEEEAGCVDQDVSTRI